MSKKKLCRICGKNESKAFRLDCKPCNDENKKNGRYGVDFYLNRPHDAIRANQQKDRFNGFY